MSKHWVLLAGLLVVIVIASVFAFALLRATTRPAAADAPARQTAESACVPVSVAVYNGRLHVECLNGAAFRFFAAPVDDPNAARFLTAMTTAMSSIPIMQMWVGYYDDTTSGPPFGCGADDCRRIAYVVVGLKEGAPLN